MIPDSANRYKTAIVLGVVLLLQSCASLNPDYERPTVTLTSFRALPSQGMVPAFEIGLQILNPNASPLNLEGIVYTISIQGHDLVKGVGKGYPVIEGYTQESITLSASANLFAGIGLVAELMRSSPDALEFEFNAKLDLGGFYPSIRISESGSFQMQDTLVQ